MSLEDHRLQLRGRDLMSLAAQTQVSPEDVRLVVEYARDLTRDADVVLARGRVLPPTVEPVIGLLRTVVALAGEQGVQ